MGALVEQEETHASMFVTKCPLKNSDGPFPATERTLLAGGIYPEISFLFTLVAGPRRSLSLKLRDARAYAAQLPASESRARL